MKKIIELVETIFENPLGKIFGVILFFTLVLTYLNYSDESYAEDFVNNDEYYGCISKKELYNKRGAHLYFFDKLSRQSKFYVYNIFSDEHKGLYEYTQIGDTIIKLKGKGRITIKKPNGEVQDFEYNSRILSNVE